MSTHKDLKVWKESVELVTSIYEKTKTYPDDEKFGLTSQIRRCSVSIPSNIAEGAARNTQKDFTRFLHMSLGSAAELQTQLLISKNLGYMNSDIYEELILKTETISKMLSGLIKSINR